MHRISRGEFERLVDEAWETIPEQFRERFENVGLFVQDEPDEDQLDAGGVPPGGDLLGLYEGIPLDRRGMGYNMAMPDRVTLFQGPIERAARSRREIPTIVYQTLWHEFAHHLGMDEDEVRAAERRRGVPDSFYD